jgi:hypothetical protein
MNQKALDLVRKQGRCPEESLLLCVITSAVIEKDLKYFESDTFQRHVDALNMDADVLLERIINKVEEANNE